MRTLSAKSVQQEWELPWQALRLGKLEVDGA